MTNEQIKADISERAKKSVLAKTAMYDAATVLLLTLHEGVRLLIDEAKKKAKATN